MKKYAALLLVLALALSLFAVNVSAEPDEPKNYLNTKWEAKWFPGKLKEEVEDGVTVTTYTPTDAQPWCSPTLTIDKAVKDMIGDNDYVEIVFSFEVRGIFKDGSDGEAKGRSMMRAINPKTHSFTFSEEDTEDWDGQGHSYEELYDEATEGDMLFAIASGNNMAYMQPTTVDILADEWTLYESEPVYVAASNVNETLIESWLWCMDQISYKDSGLQSIQFRNAAIYNYEDLAEAEEPEPTEEPEPETEPVDEPIDEPGTTETEAPEATDAPKATDAPAATDATEEPGKPAGGNTGLIIGIVAGVVVIAAIVAGILIAKKKKQ